MRTLDIRHWHLVAPAALLALAACGPGAAPLETMGEETGDGDSSDSSDVEDTETGDGRADDGNTDERDTDGDELDEGSDDAGPEDGDAGCYEVCPPGYYCGLDGWCQSEDFCLSTNECGFGEYCNSNYCYAGQELGACEAPSLVEIPLPPNVANPGYLDLQFADFDDDGRDELVLLASEMMVVVDDDLQASFPGPFDPGGGQLTALRIDDDPFIDLVVTDSESALGVVWLGFGLEFVSIPGGAGIPVSHPIAIDWPSGGPQELLAHTADGSMAMLISQLDSPRPVIEAIEQRRDEIEDVAVARVDDSGDAIVTSERCTIVIRSPSATTAYGSSFGAHDRCNLAVAQLDGAGMDDVVLMLSNAGRSFIHERLASSAQSYSMVTGEFDDFAPLDLDGDGRDELLLFGDGQVPTLLQGSPNGLACQIALPELPPASRVAAGDLDGDGGREFVLLDSEGTPRLFSHR